MKKPSRRGGEKSEADVLQGILEAASTRLRENKRLRRTLPPWGRLHIDRQLPFLCVYRRAPEHASLNLQHLVTSEAAYLYCDADPQRHRGVARLAETVADAMVEQFGAFLMLEIWPAAFDDEASDGDPQLAMPRPRFRILTQKRQNLGSFLDKFAEALSRIRIEGQAAKVDVVSKRNVAPPGSRPLLATAAGPRSGCVVVGLELLPVFKALETGEVFPQVRRQMERRLALALKRTFFDFVRSRTTHRPPHYHALGRRATVKAVWNADRLLSEVSDEFDFLLQVSPINSSDAWQTFKAGHYAEAPTFHYRPLPIDPVALKRRLYQTPVERVEDPAIGQLLRDKMNELDRQINMLMDINTPRFMHGGIQVYGPVEDSLLQLAEQILERIPEAAGEGGKSLDAEAFAEEARRELEFLRAQDHRVRGGVEVRDDINGLIVSHGSLLVGAETKIPVRRVAALLQHEIGTHVLTYYNGQAQPFRQLYAGLSGYEALQEGIAVLSEHLVGGLSRDRLRVLAARVIASRMLTDGCGYLECFQRLMEQHKFSPRTAFFITMRIFRGGGLTKDAIYLRGLQQTLEYLGGGGSLEPLLVGKLSTEHIPLIQELRWRKVLSEPILKPRYLTQADAVARLDQVRQGMSVLDLIADRGGVKKSRRPEKTAPQGAATEPASKPARAAPPEPAPGENTKR